MASTKTKIAATERALRVLRAKQKRIERRDETRRKILFGVAVLNLLETMPERERTALLSRLHTHVVRPTDREFLGLPAPATQTPAEPAADYGEKVSRGTVLPGLRGGPDPYQATTTAQAPLPLFQ